LASNTLDAYANDLQRFSRFQREGSDGPVAVLRPEDLAAYIDSLYQAGLGARSIARHLTTIRTFFAFLAREGLAPEDPAEQLRGPRQWQTIPKFLNRTEI
jgi:site-specific recombinase XerD